MEFNGQLFQNRLKDLIGKDTISEFAVKCGTSRANISRLLNSSDPIQPKKSTLQKIAGATGADYEELLAICGYAFSPADARKQRPFADRIELNALDMEKGFSELTHGKLYDSLDDFMKTYAMLYSHETCKFAIEKPSEYEGDLHQGAEQYACVCSVFKDPDEGTCFTYAVIYFAETTGGHIVVTDTAMDGKSLLEINFLPEASLNKAGIKPEELEERDYFYIVRESREQALLRKIFGESRTRRYPYTIVGFGFDIADVPPGFNDYLKGCLSSKGVFDEDPGFKDAVEDYFSSGKSPEEYFGEYEDPYTGSCGFQAAIAMAMRLETMFEFAFYEQEESSRPPCILVEDWTTSQFDELKAATKRCVKALGIKKYGERVVFTSRFEDKNLQFDVEEEK